MKVVITVDEETHNVVLAVAFDDGSGDDMHAVDLLPNEAEAIGWGLLSASDRSRTLLTAASPRSPIPSASPGANPSAN